MNVLLMSLVIALTVLAVGLWVIQLARRRRGSAASLGLALMVTVVAADGWFWAVAFDTVIGPERSLRGPVIFVSAILALGAIYGLTGTRMHSDVAGGRMGIYLGRDESMRADGWDNDPRFH